MQKIKRPMVPLMLLYFSSAVILAFLLILSPVVSDGTKISAAEIVGAEYPYLPVETDAEFAGGTGTQEDPYLISDAGQLELYRNYYGTFGTDTNYFALTNDIYINKNYRNYGKWEKTAPSHVLGRAGGYLSKSSFDGRGYTIYGIYADETSFLPGGMTEAEIKNVNFSHFYCKNTPLLAAAFSGNYAGNINISDGIIIYDKPSSRNVYGGVFGENGTYLKDYQYLENINIDVKMTVNQSGSIGLISAISTSTEAKNCSAGGLLKYTQNSDSMSTVGGLFGQSGNITGCTNNAEIIINLPKLGNITGYYGGVAGYLTGVYNAESKKNDTYPVTADGCKNTGPITVNTKYTLKYAKENNLCRLFYDAGGVFGASARHSEIKNCVNEGNIKAAFGNYIAGIAASINGNINNCLNTGAVSGDSNYSLSGIAGRVSGNIAYCENRGSISSYEQMTDKSVFFVSASAAGVVSAVFPSEDGKPVQVKYCKNTGDIYVSDKSQWTNAAGIAASLSCFPQNEGKAASVSLTYCLNSGNITSPVAGGIVCNSGGSRGKEIKIKYCVNEGTIHEPFDDDRYAGIVFYITHTEVTCCHNVGKMTSDYSNYRERTGQIAGMNNEGGVVKKCSILVKTDNAANGTGIDQLGGKSSDITRKSKKAILKDETVKKIFKNAGYRE